MENMNSEITAALIGIVSALITAFITKSNADKKNAIENITQERKKWRDDMRGATVALRRCVELSLRTQESNKSPENDSKNRISFLSISEAKAFFITRLNPTDPEDSNILNILENIIKRVDSTKQGIFSKSKRECLHCCQPNLYLVSDDNSDLLCLLCQFEESMSVLLKYDWERAKCEVYGHSWIKWLITGILVSLGMFLVKDVKTDLLNFRPISFLLFKISSLVTGLFLIFTILFGPINSFVKKIMFTAPCLIKIFGIPFRQTLSKEEITSEKNTCLCFLFVLFFISTFLFGFIVLILKSILEMQ
ncbi:MAG: hypothetical protein IKZ45_01360 [Fibrobacter sp.]|nr:hypothetical protein [Fibrobacter sp.]MBR5411527.1 hypothetical protein [Fibrobacter sp.]